MLTASHILDMARVIAVKEGVPLTTISSRMFDDGKRLGAIENRGADLTLSRASKALRWLSDNWPGDIEWPANIPRAAPSPKEGEAA